MKTIQQYKEMLEQAPEGATHCMQPDEKVPVIYVMATPLHDFYWNIANANGKWQKAMDRQIGVMNSLSGLQTIVDQAETIERLKDGLNAALRACYDLDAHSVRHDNSDYNNAMEIQEDLNND